MKRFTPALMLICLVFRVNAQVAIQNVTVVDVASNRLLPNQNVLIVDDRIQSVGNASQTKIPSHFTVIDGSSQFLMPGMIDAHIHFFQSGGLYARPDAINLQHLVPYAKEIETTVGAYQDYAKRYLREGITTVVDVGATPRLLQLRNRYQNNSEMPTILTSGPLLTTYLPKPYHNLGDNAPFELVKTPQEGIQAVQKQLSLKPDFIKIWYIVMASPEQLEAEATKHEPLIKAIIEESHRNGVRVAVHATEQATATIAVRNGADYLVHGIENEPVSSEFINLLKRNKTVLCPTLIVEDNYNSVFGQSYTADKYSLRKANPFTLGSVFDMHLPSIAHVAELYKRQVTSPEMKRTSTEHNRVRMLNLQKLAAAGVPIVAGTDAGNIGTQHATSYLDELLAMQKAGMTTWDVLRSGTRAMQELHPALAGQGEVTLGKTADLLLLTADPTRDLSNLRKIALVIKKGKTIRPDTLLPESPEMLVQRQLNAYNAHNIEAFLETYADDVELYDFPDKLISKGKAAIQPTYEQMFTNLPELFCQLKNRITNGNYVIDRESVTWQKGKPTAEATAIYEVQGGLIKRVWFISEK